MHFISSQRRNVPMGINNVDLHLQKINNTTFNVLFLSSLFKIFFPSSSLMFGHLSSPNRVSQASEHSTSTNVMQVTATHLCMNISHAVRFTCHRTEQNIFSAYIFISNDANPPCKGQ